MPNCESCKKPMATESFQSDDGDYLGYFCNNPHCPEYDGHLAGWTRDEALAEELDDN